MPTPYADLSSMPSSYSGPVDPPQVPANLHEIRLGLFVPVVGERASVGRSVRRGVGLAVQEANRDGGLHGVPFVVVEGRDDGPWGSAREVVRLAYDEHVWAIIGGVDGESSHVVEQVVTKARLPLVAPLSTDVSFTEINIPWVFRLMPDDDTIAVATLDALPLDGVRPLKFFILADETYDHRQRARRLELHARRRGLEVERAAVEGSMKIQNVLSAGEIGDELDSVVVVIGPMSERAVAGLIRAGAVLDTVYLGRPEPGTRFSPAAEVPTQAWTPCGGTRVPGFADRYQQAYGEPPTVEAMTAYDSARVVITAIRRAGLDRSKIRAEVSLVRTDEGACSPVAFTGQGDNAAAQVELVGRRPEMLQREDSP